MLGRQLIASLSGTNPQANPYQNSATMNTVAFFPYPEAARQMIGNQPQHGRFSLSQNESPDNDGYRGNELLTETGEYIFQSQNFPFDQNFIGAGGLFGDGNDQNTVADNSLVVESQTRSPESFPAVAVATNDPVPSQQYHSPYHPPQLSNTAANNSSVHTPSFEPSTLNPESVLPTTEAVNHPVPSQPSTSPDATPRTFNPVQSQRVQDVLRYNFLVDLTQDPEAEYTDAELATYQQELAEIKARGLVQIDASHVLLRVEGDEIVGRDYAVDDESLQNEFSIGGEESNKHRASTESGSEDEQPVAPPVARRGRTQARPISRSEIIDYTDSDDVWTTRTNARSSPISTAPPPQSGGSAPVRASEDQRSSTALQQPSQPASRPAFHHVVAIPASDGWVPPEPPETNFIADRTSPGYWAQVTAFGVRPLTNRKGFNADLDRMIARWRLIADDDNFFYARDERDKTHASYMIGRLKEEKKYNTAVHNENLAAKKDAKARQGAKVAKKPAKACNDVAKARPRKRKRDGDKDDDNQGTPKRKLDLVRARWPQIG
jgi:hypothetical protein